MGGHRVSADDELDWDPTDVGPPMGPADFDVMDSIRESRLDPNPRPYEPTPAPASPGVNRSAPFVTAVRRAMTAPTEEERIRDRGAIVDTPEGGREIELEPFVIEGDPRTDEQKPTELTSYVRGIGNTVAMGQMPRILAAADSIVGGDYDERLQDWQRAYSDSARDNPDAYNTGSALGIAGTVLTPAGPLARAAGSAPTALGRIGRGAALSGVMEAVPAVLDAPNPFDDPGRFTDQVVGRVIPAIGLGAGMAGLGEFARLTTNPDTLNRAADHLDDMSVPYRVRSAGARTQGFQRMVDDLPGGQTESAHMLDQTGIMPRGTMFGSVDQARQRAEQVRSGAGARIEAIRQDMDVLYPNGLRNMPSMFMEERLPGTVSRGPLINQLQQTIDNTEGLLTGDARQVAARSLLQDAQNSGNYTFQQAFDEKRGFDNPANFHGPSPNARLAPMVQDRRDLRRALVNSMDDAVGQDLGPSRVSEFQRARREYQQADLYERMGHDSELREAANRIFSPSDMGAFGLGLLTPGGNGPRAVAFSVLNRMLRGREASMAAGTMERTADALRAVAARNPAQAPVVQLLIQAGQRGPVGLAQTIQFLEQTDPQMAEAAYEALAATAPAEEQDPQLRALDQSVNESMGWTGNADNAGAAAMTEQGQINHAGEPMVTPDVTHEDTLEVLRRAGLLPDQNMGPSPRGTR